MGKPLSSAARTYLRKLRNPYAAEQLDEEVATSPDVSQSTLQSRDSPQLEQGDDGQGSEVWVLQDPYASLSGGGHASQRKSLRSVATRTCSKVGFRNGCKHIFRQYSPAPEKGALREEHLAFIARNEDRSPEIRYALLRELQRYDLSNIPG